MPYALLLFVAMPIIEIAVLLRVGSALGWAPTLLIVIATAFLGTAMLRQQGLATLAKARSRLDSGEMPAEQLLEGVLIMIGGVFLLTPGFVTDAFGFACLIPFTRHWLAQKAAGRLIVGVTGSATSAPFNETSTRRPEDTRFRNTSSSTTSRTASRTTPAAKQESKSGDVIDGDFRRIDDE